MLVQLMWKEFREHVWKMVGIGLVILPLVVWTESPFVHRRYHGTWLPVWIFLAWVAPVWLAALTITAEKRGRTALLLGSLPVSRTLVFLMKTVWGVATFVVPLLVALGLGYASLGERGDFSFSGAIESGITLYVLILCVGMHLVREGVAAMVGVLVLLLGAIWVAVDSSGGFDGRWRDIATLCLILNPFAAVYGTPHLNCVSFFLVLTAQAGVTVLYWALAAVRYGRQAFGPRWEETSLVQAEPSAAARWVLAAFRHPLFWKERREQFAVLAATAAAGVGLAILFMLIAARGNQVVVDMGWGSLNDLLATLVLMGVFIPAIVAAILGVSAMAGDLEEKVAGFWRSRPMRAGRVFWMKFGFALLGVVILAAFFEAPYFVLTSQIRPLYFGGGHLHLAFSASYVLVREAVGLPLALSLACLFATVLRRTLIAMMLVVGVGLGILFCPVRGWETVWDIFIGDYLPQLFMPLAVGMVVLTVACTVLARVAFGRGWQVG